MKSSLILLLSSLLSTTVTAWGGLGHMTVAFIAENLVASHTKTWWQTVLNNTEDDSGYAAHIATWADSYRYTRAGRFSAPFHFIDANDDPPDVCGVYVDRDCGLEGCVVGAIKNYTARVLDETLSPIERQIAAKFVIHLIGDTHQPLHAEALSKGGNGVHCLWHGKPINLHSIWDTYIPESIVGGGYKIDDAFHWAANLTHDILVGEYSDAVEQWKEGLSLNDPIGAALGWASEANKWVCSHVIPDGKEAYEGRELAGGEYLRAAVPVVRLQVARAGYRLALWMDLIAAAGAYNHNGAAAVPESKSGPALVDQSEDL